MDDSPSTTGRGPATSDQDVLDSERIELLARLHRGLEVPLIVLGFAWLALLVAELAWGLTPMLEKLGTVIWAVFILDFVIKLVLAPRKVAYLRREWLTVVALLIPALRVFRVVRVARILRVTRVGGGLRLVRLLTGLNRGMRGLGASMGRRGFGYVVGLTLLVTVAGAAGIYAFERGARGGPDSFGVALWWTAMLLTTMGSDYWPRTPEGRVLCFVLALYAFGVFGYVTAALASFFVDRDAEEGRSAVVGARVIEEVRAELAALRAELAASRGDERPGRA